MKKILKFVVFILALSLVIAGACFFYYQAVTATVKLDENKLNGAVQSCVVFDGDGKKVEFGKVAEYVKIEDVPANLKNAFIAIEDKRFYKHNGVDYKSVLRAVKNNLFARSVKEGASTISQQLAKNVFLSGEKTLNRKLCEIKLAREIEKKYDKDEILEKYLNKIYFGNGAYGISTAANVYFGKKVNELTVAENAVLAAVIKAPSSYDPFTYTEKCKNRRNLVLKEQFNQNLISKEEYEAAIAEEISLKTKNDANENSFASEVVNSALEILKLSSVDELNGFQIYSCVKSEYLDRLPTARDYSLDENYCVMIIDNTSGKVLAYKSDLSAVKRCPASAAKPWLIYAPAIEEKLITEATKILDEKTNFGDYSPSNVGDKYYGFVSVKDSLAKSLNVPSVKITEMLGVAKIKSYAEKLGVEFSNDDLSVGLGNLSGGTTLVELASAYSPFVNNGEYSRCSLINKIVSPKGKIVYEYKKRGQKVFSRGTCDVVNDILSETVKTGTAKKLSDLPFTVCAKTGTGGNKNGNSDAFCIAYTNEYTVAAWIGKTDDKLMKNKISGGTYPAAIVRDALSSIYKNSQPTDFSTSDEVVKVRIDKKSYDEKHELLVRNDGEKSTREFLFLRGTEPQTQYAEEVTSNIKDCKITYNKGEIYISVIADENAAYSVVDYKNKIRLEGKGSKDFTIATLLPSTVYEFYVISEGSGDKIKLPSIKTDGNKIVDEWWVED